MMRTALSMVLSVLAFVTICLLMLVSAGEALPEGFVSEIVSPRTKAVTGIFVPNLRRTDHRPMMLLISKKGRVRVLENPENLDTDDDEYINKEDEIDNDDNTESNLILDLSGEGTLCIDGERGLTSIVAHPNFLENGWVYLYYTRWSQWCLEDPVLGPQNILVRYTMNSTTLLLENEQLLVEFGVLGERVHNGGGMMFGTDGYLYLATGDGGVRQHAQNRQNLHGSLLRLNDDGSVPDDNPYARNSTLGVPCGKSDGVVPEIFASKEGGENVFCSEIYAWGFRNPIRMALNHKGSNSEKVLFSISDVGAQLFEELSWGGTDYKEKDYGWPNLEGPCITDSIDDCPLPSPDSNRIDPFHYYVHKSYENGGCVAGSTFVPDGIWPDEYKYLFIDFIFLKIYNLIEDPESECRESCSPPTSGYSNETFFESIHEEGENINEARIIDMFFGPYKDTEALYVIKYGNNNSILRIRYTGVLGVPPVAKIKIENEQENIRKDTTSSLPTSSASNIGTGQVLPLQKTTVVGKGQVINFDGSGSFDPEGNGLSFTWDFGDGNNSTANATNLSYAYEVAGEYNVSLVVTDSKNKEHQAFFMVLVRKTPTVDMLSPKEGDLFSMGDILHLDGEAYDNQGNRIPDDQLIWEVRVHQDDQLDSLLNKRSGNDFHLDPALGPEDLNGFLSIMLQAMDDDGLTTTIVRKINLDVVDVKLTTDPEGLNMTIDGVAVISPYHIQSWVNFELPMEVKTEQSYYRFKNWSDDNTNSSHIFVTTPRENATIDATQAKERAVSITAIFCLDSNAPCGDVTTTCCSGICDEMGFCKDELQDSVSVETKPTAENVSMTDPDLLPPYPHGTIVASQIMPHGYDTEPDQKPGSPGIDSSIFDEPELDVINSSTILDEQSNLGEQNAYYGLRPYGKWLLSIFLTIFSIAPCYLGWKYLQLKRQMEAETKISTDKEVSDEPLTPKTVVAISSEQDTPVPLFESNTSNISFQRSGTIWDRIAEETERRAKLRAKYCCKDTPKTPDTAEYRGSPSSFDSFSSPSSVLTNNIDQTLVRLDDLLSKTFSRKLSRISFCQKQEEHNDLSDGGDRKSGDLESGDFIEKIEDSEQSTLAPLWLSSNQNSVPGSPMRDDSNCSKTAGENLTLGSLYALGSSKGDLNTSQVVRLSEMCDNSVKVFQDNNLSAATSNTSEGNLRANDAANQQNRSDAAGDGGGNHISNI